MLYGVSYYPEQKTKEELEQDLTLIKQSRNQYGAAGGICMEPYGAGGGAFCIRLAG